MKNIHPLVHNALLNGEDVKPLSDDEKVCLEEIRDVLAKYNKLDRFGVTLLHKHFDISDDEIMIESINEEKRQQIIQPMKRSEVERMRGEILETSWSLQYGNEVIAGCKRSCVKVDGKHYPDVHVHTGS